MSDITHTPENTRAGFVHLFGRTNAGKSTLLNALVEEKVAIVSPKAQTTRHRILAIRNDPGLQTIFVDYPGVHRPLFTMNRRMMGLIVRSFLDAPDAVLFLVDASKPFGRGDEYTLGLLEKADCPVFLVLNKIDLIKEKVRLLPLISRYREKYDFKDVIPVSALKEKGLDVIFKALAPLMPEGPLLYPEDLLTDRPESFVIEEIIREQVLAATREEIPHAVAVRLETREKRGKALALRAVIWIERDSQKKILIGKKGAMMKRISTRARENLEEFLGEKIFLELWVKAKKDWREKGSLLDEMGICAKDE